MARRPSEDPQLTAILDRSGDAASVAWAHQGVGDVASLPHPLSAITAAEQLGNIAALQAVQGPKELRKAASTALHRLRSRGVEVKEAPRPAAWRIPVEEVSIPCRAFLSVPDREGDMELMLNASDAEGLCLLSLIIGGSELVRESNHSHCGRGELRNLWSEVERRKMHAELPFAAGLHYAERLLAGRRSSDWKHFLAHVAPATLTSARILDPMMNLPAADADEPIAPNWHVPASLLDAGKLHRGYQRVMKAMRDADEGATVPMETLMDSAADDALDEAARLRLDLYLELVIAATRHKGWIQHAERVEAIRGQLAEGVPGHEIPAIDAGVKAYITEEMMRVLRESMLENMGFDPNAGREDEGDDEPFDLESDEELEDELEGEIEEEIQREIDEEDGAGVDAGEEQPKAEG